MAGDLDSQKNITLQALKTASSTEQATTTILIDGIADSFSNTSGIDTTNSINLVTGTAGQVSKGSVTTNATTTYTSSNTYIVPTGVTSVDYLVVAGGGGGGKGGDRGGGGGGAGGFRTGTLSVTPGASLTVTVGAGGAGGTSSAHGSQGSSSVFDTITAAGGGGGGSESLGTAGSGGSGGGGSGSSTTGAGSGNTPSTSPPQGNNGGAGVNSGNFTGGGGGGAGAAGTGGTEQTEVMEVMEQHLPSPVRRLLMPVEVAERLKLPVV